MELRVAVSVAASLVVLSAGPALAQRSIQLPFRPANQEALQNYSPELPPNGPSSLSVRSQGMTEAAARRLPEQPDSLDTFEMLAYTEQVDAALATLRRLIDGSPKDIAPAFELLLYRPQWVREAVAQGRMPEPLPGLLAAARQKIPALPREDAARLERTLVLLEYARVGVDPRKAAALRDVIGRYPDTAAAQEAEVDLLEATTNDRTDWIATLDDIVRRHPGTTAAARALHEKAFQLSSNLRPRANADPTDQFLTILGIVKELESGRYPPNRWSATAAWLGAELYWRNVAALAPANVDRLLAAYLDFVRAHFTAPETGELANGVRTLLNDQVFALFALKNDGIGGIERTLAGLEPLDPERAQYWRGAFYVDRLKDATGQERAGLVDKARTALSGAAAGTGLYGRLSLATLASLEYNEGRYDAARLAFSAYLTANPATPFSWVAALRIGQCAEKLGDLDDAVRTYEEVATRFAAIVQAHQLALVYAGRANERRGQVAGAIADYERALTTWGDRRGTLRLDSSRPSNTGNTFADATGTELEGRVAELKTAPSAALERLRAHRAQLQTAVELATLSNASRDDTTALGILASMERETDDVARVAQVVRAMVLARQGRTTEAAQVMSATLTAWRDQQASVVPVSTLPPEVAADVAAIRTRIQEGEPPDAEWRRQFEWRALRSQFTVIEPDLFVAQAGGVPKQETIPPPRAAANVLLMNTATMKLLVDSLNGVTGQRRSGTAFLPVSLSSGLTAFLQSYLPADNAMMGGLATFASIPNVLSVLFDDEARTRATVEIRTWSSGGTLLVEKQGGEWRVTRVVSAYVN